MSDDELIDLVAEATRQHHLDADGEGCICGAWGDGAFDGPDWDAHLAEVAVRALAGRLLPPVVSEEVRWRVVGIPGHGFPPYRYDWGTDEAAARKWMQKVLGRDGDWFDGPTLKVRTIRTFADDSTHSTAWREVSP